ncbi:MAG TPA: response regulator [Roseiarcus sp.]|nr:response regulator [Roseiarcus sp.]
MTATDKVNVLLVDDQPAKLLAYDVILSELGENLIKVSSGREALEQLLRHDIAVVLIDVSMPELDGFQLAAMIREHPRFEKTAIIFVSAIHLSDVDHLRGYEMGAVDYVPVPVVPEVLRAKVRVFAELHRKTRQLENLNEELERRVAERTADLEASNELLVQSERRRSLALAAGHMGSWDFDARKGDWRWDEGQYRIFGVDPATFTIKLDNLRRLIDPNDWTMLFALGQTLSKSGNTQQAEFRILRPDGELRWCIGTVAATFDAKDKIVRIGGVTIDITERKQTEERQALLAREVDHRARNALAIIQAIIRLTRADSIGEYKETVEGRIMALARAHTLLSESRWSGADFHTLVADELAPYRADHAGRIVTSGPPISLEPITAQTLALALHELATNAAKYGALSSSAGALNLTWEVRSGKLILRWSEVDAPSVRAPSASGGFGLKLISTSIEQQLAGTVSFDWTPRGLKCDIVIPFNERPDSSAMGPAKDEDAAPASAESARGMRVLLVEDEALVAMMTQEMLASFGCSIVGPCATVASALATVEDEAIDLALLDVNLGHESVYPVADALAARGAPFVFLTGYDSGHVDGRFRDALVLQKPVDREVLGGILAAQSSRESPSAETRIGPAETPSAKPRRRSQYERTT